MGFVPFTRDTHRFPKGQLCRANLDTEANEILVLSRRTLICLPGCRAYMGAILSWFWDGVGFLSHVWGLRRSWQQIEGPAPCRGAFSGTQLTRRLEQKGAKLQVYHPRTQLRLVVWVQVPKPPIQTTYGLPPELVQPLEPVAGPGPGLRRPSGGGPADAGDPREPWPGGPVLACSGLGCWSPFCFPALQLRLCKSVADG